MIEDYLDSYKKEVKAKYEIEKNGDKSSIFISPSRAKLRNLCIEIFKDCKNNDDLNSFASFFGFQFNPENSNKLKDNTDKFRPIETFFKGETDLVDIEGVNLAAILVDFQPRPYLKYSKKGTIESRTKSDIEVVIEESREEVGIQSLVSEFKSLDGDISTIEEGKVTKIETRDSIFKSKFRLIGSLAVIVLTVLGIAKYSVTNKECMEWQKNHYEIVDCETKSVGYADINSKIPLNENLLHLRKIKVCDTTTFFKNNRAIVWYYKNGEQLELFNAPFNPENNKPLKPITQYMIDKYLK